jgi:hypothetical protein
MVCGQEDGGSQARRGVQGRRPLLQPAARYTLLCGLVSSSHAFSLASASVTTAIEAVLEQNTSPAQ